MTWRFLPISLGFLLLLTPGLSIPPVSATGMDESTSQEEPGEAEVPEEEPGEEEEPEGEAKKEEEKEEAPEQEPAAQKPPEDEAADEKPSPLEFDRSSPRYLVKDLPSFTMLRPAAPRAKKAKAGKSEAAVDGGRWGFVDLSLRKKRVEALWDRRISTFEKQSADESIPPEARDAAKRNAAGCRSLKSRKLKELDGIRCLVALPESPGVYLQVESRDRERGAPEKSIRDSYRNWLTANGIKVKSERPETWAGKRVPAYTFLCESAVGGGSEGPLGALTRLTYCIVPKGKAGTSIVLFQCHAPKALRSEQIEKEFDAFIRGTQF